ncbi:MAG TPA: glycosyltransferase family 39 protein [Steroidobacteraceae bacterium]|nr:glycosyltransferase family 39 protein [Steroidobacteraceae bacterium]
MRRWPLAVIVALAPLWLIGILDRGAWTPDEPREADIAWRMSLQHDWSLPHLADTPFLEKPPLSYWMAATALHIYGDSPQAARLPNILYAFLTALAIGALAFAMEGPSTAIVAAIAVCTAITSYRVAVWLAPDACLLAGCAIALLGAYLGFTAPPGRRKLLGYMILHAGAAVGFMAKSAPGWLVPALALLTLIVWERRWSELVRWELYAGFLLQALVIVPWILAVTHTEHGAEALRAILWNNTLGRFTSVSSSGAPDYTTGHHNSPGKYLRELPVYLLPWTLLGAAAVRRAWSRVRIRSAQGTAWRFAVAAIVPFLVLLSLAATARDIYAAPILLGFGLLIGLWATEISVGHQAQRPARLDRFALTGTRAIIALIAAALIIALAMLTAASGNLTYLTAAAAVAALAIIALKCAAYMQKQDDMFRALAWTYTAYAATLTLGGLAVFPAIDRWQDLPVLAHEIREDTRGIPLALLTPDETTIAMLDHRSLVVTDRNTGDTPDGAHFPPPFSVLNSDTAAAETAVAGWFRQHGPRAQVLVKLPGRGPGELSRLFDRLSPPEPTGDGLAGTLVSEGVAAITHRYELPQGRRYALLGPPEH